MTAPTTKQLREAMLAELAVKNVIEADRMGIDVPEDVRRRVVDRYLMTPVADLPRGAR